MLQGIAKFLPRGSFSISAAAWNASSIFIPSYVTPSLGGMNLVRNRYIVHHLEVMELPNSISIFPNTSFIILFLLQCNPKLSGILIGSIKIEQSIVCVMKEEENEIHFSIKTLFDNPIQYLNLMDLDFNIFKPFDNQKLNI